MVNFEKYKNDGWGLSKKCFNDIFNIIKTFSSNPINVLEFGSGVSTQFLVDLIEKGYNLNITSYDNDIVYATKAKHPNLKLIICDLVETYDSDFENLFQEKKYEKSVFHKMTTEIDFRQKNVFYNVEEEQLPKNIDLMIVDGPHGNGRSIAFLHGIGRLKSNSHVIIDDYNHYDFVKRFEKIYPNSELIYSSNSGQENKWELGGNYVIFRIK